MKDRIRVRLRGFDVRLIDDSAKSIVSTANYSRSDSLSMEK